MSKRIPLEIKKQCVEKHNQGLRTKEIYKFFCEATNSNISYNSFTSHMTRWNRKNYADKSTLDAGTYKGFTAHDATVQISGDGEIVQAWVKQAASDLDVDEFLKAIECKTEKYKFTEHDHINTDVMLEIPLFDMHFGIADFDYYKNVLDSILSLILSKKWDKVIIPFGQDFFHNDSVVKGETTKGTKIQKVDTEQAVKDGKKFIFAIIDAAIENSNKTEVFYSPGNHDKSLSWMFMQVLSERYGENIVDDSICVRREIHYGKNSIMVTHGNAKKDTPETLAHVFPIKFPEGFSNADVREIHAGHLHHEMSKDVFGVMVRRLSSGCKEDDWSDEEDHVGAHKRFQLFEWSLSNLKDIHYIYTKQ